MVPEPATALGVPICKRAPVARKRGREELRCGPSSDDLSGFLVAGEAAKVGGDVEERLGALAVALFLAADVAEQILDVGVESGVKRFLGLVSGRREAAVGGAGAHLVHEEEQRRRLGDERRVGIV